MYYIPRKVTNFDKLYTEDDQSVYDQTFLIEMYIKSIDGFTGDGNFLSKFGVEIRDQVTFSVAQRIFNQEIGVFTGQSRPNEGDLIYFPLNKKCFQIRYTNKFEMFYQLGGLQTWEMTCELFEYSNETINTGIAEIDALQTKMSTNILDYALKDENNAPLSDENKNILVTQKYVLENINPTADNSTIQQGSNNFPSGSDTFIDFSEQNPFTEGNI